jgi:hypothetical protein
MVRKNTNVLMRDGTLAVVNHHSNSDLLAVLQENGFSRRDFISRQATSVEDKPSPWMPPVVVFHEGGTHVELETFLDDVAVSRWIDEQRENL